MSCGRALDKSMKQLVLQRQQEDILTVRDICRTIEARP